MSSAVPEPTFGAESDFRAARARPSKTIPLDKFNTSNDESFLATGDPMARSIVLKIPHALGRAEATRRIEEGIARARPTLPAVVSFREMSRDEGSISFAIDALGQTVNAQISIEDDYVIFDANLPILLSPFSGMASSAVGKWATRLLRVPQV